ncbi:MAG: tetraacyldisaccharide 4'-kinase [Bacteroidetes bacterium]|nr:tetraacyldisaccharide 4'-kinase [Bacteroidota bacterium]
MKYLRWLLFPFSLLYGLVVIIRNWCYDGGILKSRKFGIPTICIGNLEVGGAGKTPMTEYLIALFKDHYNLATLSRGYGRSTKGYLTATATATSAEIGDEPAQFKHKLPDVTVAVCEDRVAGVRHLQKEHKLIILDDAFQHRAIKPGFNILLFDFNKLDEPRLLLPAGNFREPFSGRWRADILVATKCPASLSADRRTDAIQRLEPLPWQHVFFTTIDYLPLRGMNGQQATVTIDSETTVFLLTGIANAAPLVERIKGYTQYIVHHNYPDHHRFSLKNIAKLAGEFEACTSQKKVIVTTEKDEQRLLEHELAALVNTLPISVAPIGIRFLDNGQQEFDRLIKKHVREHTANHIVH